MARKAKAWRDCRCQDDFRRAAQARHDCRWVNGGRHEGIEANGRFIPIPGGETATGTRGAILRSLKSAGLLAALIIAFLSLLQWPPWAGLARALIVG